MYKVLIADMSDSWRELLERELEKEYQVCSCADGSQALKLVETFSPDVMVMDLILAGADGLSVLKSLQNDRKRPCIIATGRYFSDYMAASLERYQVELVMQKPCTAQGVSSCIAELLAWNAASISRDISPEEYITKLLMSLSVPTSQQGFRYLRRGILLLMDDPVQQLTKELYPNIARENNTSAINVEKAMRTAVTKAWNNRREEIWRKYFPLTAKGQITKPTTGQFLARLTDLLLNTINKQA